MGSSASSEAEDALLGFVPPKSSKVLTFRRLDPNAVDCAICTAPFSMCTRKHFCRRCRKIVCEDCSVLKHYSSVGHPPTRCCKSCDVCLFLAIPLKAYHHINSYLPNQSVNVMLHVCKQLQRSVQLPYVMVDGWKSLFGHAKFLAKGAFGRVYQTTMLEGNIPCAVKLIAKDKIYSLRKWVALVREIEAHKRCQHENVIRMFKVAQTVDCVYIVLEYANNGDLFEWIHSSRMRSEDECRAIFKQLMNAICYLHNDVGIVHRDIKPENVLMDGQQTIKLADFGFAKFLGKQTVSVKPAIPSGSIAGSTPNSQTVLSLHNQQRRSAPIPIGNQKPSSFDSIMATPCGTLGFAPPEVLESYTVSQEKQVSSEVRHLKAADVYSCGVVLAILLTGSEPFPSYVDTATHMKIAKQGVRTDTAPWRNVSKDAKDLITWMLAPLPENRPTAVDVMMSLWMRKAMTSPVSTYTSPNKQQQQQQQQGAVGGKLNAPAVSGTTGTRQRRPSITDDHVSTMRIETQDIAEREHKELSRTIVRQLYSEWAVSPSTTEHSRHPTKASIPPTPPSYSAGGGGSTQLPFASVMNSYHARTQIGLGPGSLVAQSLPDGEIY